MVKRRRDPNDGRVVIVELTDKGWAALASATPLVFQAEKELLAAYSRSELQTLAGLLRRLFE